MKPVNIHLPSHEMARSRGIGSGPVRLREANQSAVPSRVSCKGLGGSNTFDRSQMKTTKDLTTIRFWLGAFMALLLISGLTAIPLKWELEQLQKLYPMMPQPLVNWLDQVYAGIAVSTSNHPFLAYGTDWLAFAHIVIAIAFIGPFIDPVRNIWVIEFGLLACLAVIPFAFIMGEVRRIPFWWRLIDCSFGVFGAIPLLICHRKIVKLEKNHTI